MAAATKEPKKVKKGFKMPHLFWIMICLLLVSSLLTYVIPAGQFMTDPETGKILGDQFQYLGTQTPVSPLQVFLLHHRRYGKLLAGRLDRYDLRRYCCHRYGHRCVR